MKSVLKSLESICSENITKRKILVMPGYTEGLNLLNTLSLNNVNIANIKVETPLNLAKDISKLSLYKSGKDFLDRSSARYVILNLFNKLLTENELKYFRQLSPSAGVIIELENVLYELRITDFTHKNFPENSFIDPAKEHDIKTLLQQYENYLENNNRIDEPGLYKHSIQMLQKESFHKDKLFLIPANLELPLLPKNFISELTENNHEIIKFTQLQSINVPENYYSSNPYLDTIDNCFSWLYELNNSENLDKNPGLQIYRAYGESNEAKKVIRILKRDAINLDDAVIYTTSSQLYNQILYDLSCTYNIPMTFEEGISVSNTSPGKLLLSVLEWISEKYSVPKFCSMLTGGFFKFSNNEVSPLKISKILKESKIAWGRKRYKKILENKLDSTTNANEKETISTIFSELNSIFDEIPDAENDTSISSSEFAKGLIDILNKHTRIRNETDASALTTITENLSQMAGYSTQEFQEKEIIKMLKKLVYGININASSAKPGHIHVTGFQNGIWHDRKHNFILGLDAENIAKYIKYAVEGGIKLARNEEEKSKGFDEKPVYSDFLIITKHKDLLEKYANTLEKYGIPSTVTGDDFFSQSEEINHIYKLLKFLSKADDEILLVSVLRGMFFGLSDDDLYQFKAARGYFNIFSSIPESLDENIKNLFDSCFSILRKYKKIINNLLPSSALETIFQDLGVLPYTSLKNLSKSRAANIYFLIEQAKQKETTEFYSFGNVVNHIGRLLESSFEQRNNLEVENNCVRIMNLHKAKGLEAPVVFLANPHKNTKHDPFQHINRRNGEPVGYFALTKKKGPYQKEIFAHPENWEEFQEEEQMFLDAEFERLVYVAVTRAKNLLIISCKENGNGSKNPWLSLLNNLNDDDVIDVPDVSIEHDSGENELSLNEINEKKAEISQWRHSVSEENYSNMTPTEVKDLEKIFAGKRLEGGGQDWGTAVHNFLEFAVITRDIGFEDLDTYIKFTFEELDISFDRIEEAKKIIEDFKQTDLFNRIKKAEQVETEAPISMKINPESEIKNLLNAKTNNKPVILSGVIDLVFKETDGWVIIDYKTDRVSFDEEYEKLRQAYLNQVEIYEKVWEEITGESVKDKDIYFVK